MLWISVVSAVTSSFSLLIVLSCVFCSLLLLSLANSTLLSFIFIVVSISLTSTLIFMISFLLKFRIWIALIFLCWDVSLGYCLRALCFSNVGTYLAWFPLWSFHIPEYIIYFPRFHRFCGFVVVVDFYFAFLAIR